MRLLSNLRRANHLFFAVFTLFAVAPSSMAFEARTHPACTPVSFEGELQQGDSLTHRITSQLDFKLEAVPSGWILRILPHAGARPPHDYAELANPPYRSPTPLLLTTDFSFRAQDAIAWNPRHFRFFTSSADLSAAEAAFQEISRNPGKPSAGSALFPLLRHAREGELRILDTEILPGSADQSAAARSVASHLAATPHRLRSNLPSTPLGRLLDLRFAVRIPCGP